MKKILLILCFGLFAFAPPENYHSKPYIHLDDYEGIKNVWVSGIETVNVRGIGYRTPNVIENAYFVPGPFFTDSISTILLGVIMPVPTYINVGDKVTSADGNAHELQFNDVVGRNGQQLYIIVDSGNAGTIKFSAGKAPTASSQPYAASERIPITIVNGSYNLWYQASGAAQSFSVTQ